MTARIDASQVEAFQRRLQVAARTIEQEADRFEEKWGDELVDEMRATVPRATGTLQASIEQVEPGGITMAHYWRFLEYGTAHMAPRPFVRPAMQRIRKPAAEDAGDRAVRLIARG